MKINQMRIRIIPLFLPVILYLSCTPTAVNIESSPVWEDLDREPVPEPVEGNYIIPECVSFI